mgnify:CR=1 FL=1
MKIGLTGGIASGKSTVAAMLSELGAVIVDGDLIAREVVARGTPGLAEVVAAFGPGILTREGELNRPALGAIVFADEAARRRLESLIHPRIAARAAELVSSAPEGALVIEDMPLLVEGGMQARFDEVIVVDVPEELQVQRMCEDRGMTPADAHARMAAQASRAERLAAATVVIANTGTLEELRARVEQVYGDLVARAAQT